MDMTNNTSPFETRWPSVTFLSTMVPVSRDWTLISPCAGMRYPVTWALRVYAPPYDRIASAVATATAAIVSTRVETGGTSNTAPTACSCWAVMTSGLKSGGARFLVGIERSARMAAARNTAAWTVGDNRPHRGAREATTAYFALPFCASSGAPGTTGSTPMSPFAPPATTSSAAPLNSIISDVLTVTSFIVLFASPNQLTEPSREWGTRQTALAVGLSRAIT